MELICKPTPTWRGSHSGPAAASKQADPWQEAPAPAQAGKRLLEPILATRPVSPRMVPVLTHLMHARVDRSFERDSERAISVSAVSLGGTVLVLQARGLLTAVCLGAAETGPMSLTPSETPPICMI